MGRGEELRKRTIVVSRRRNKTIHGALDMTNSKVADLSRKLSCNIRILRKRPIIKLKHHTSTQINSPTSYNSTPDWRILS